MVALKMLKIAFFDGKYFLEQLSEQTKKLS